jgi:hypothetical protein
MTQALSKLIDDAQKILASAVSGLNEQKGKQSNKLQMSTNYSLYVAALNQAIALGYNATIACPIMTGSPLEWAHFHAVLVNEIICFTSIVKTPACLISGGPLDKSADRNKIFAEEALGNLRSEKTVLVAYSDLATNQNLILAREFHDAATETTAEYKAKKSVIVNYSHAETIDLKLDLRIFMIV